MAMKLFDVFGVFETCCDYEEEQLYVFAEDHDSALALAMQHKRSTNPSMKWSVEEMPSVADGHVFFGIFYEGTK